MDKHQMAFKEEAYELLGELEAALMALEENPQDDELIRRVFRAMHTIKGSGAMFGFDAISGSPTMWRPSSTTSATAGSRFPAT
jgi:two-component system chemotaxis sensor kinase CheA